MISVLFRFIYGSHSSIFTLLFFMKYLEGYVYLALHVKRWMNFMWCLFLMLHDFSGFLLLIMLLLSLILLLRNFK